MSILPAVASDIRLSTFSTALVRLAGVIILSAQCHQSVWIGLPSRPWSAAVDRVLSELLVVADGNGSVLANAKVKRIYVRRHYRRLQPSRDVRDAIIVTTQRVGVAHQYNCISTSSP